MRQELSRVAQNGSAIKNFFYLTHFFLNLAFDLIGLPLIAEPGVADGFAGGLFDFAFEIFGGASGLVFRTIFHGELILRGLI